MSKAIKKMFEKEKILQSKDFCFYFNFRKQRRSETNRAKEDVRKIGEG